MKKITPKQENFKILATFMMLAMLSIGCNNSTRYEKKPEQEVKSKINLDEKRTKLETSVFGFKEAVAKADAKAAAKN